MIVKLVVHDQAGSIHYYHLMANSRVVAFIYIYNDHCAIRVRETHDIIYSTYIFSFGIYTRRDINNDPYFRKYCRLHYI